MKYLVVEVNKCRIIDNDMYPMKQKYTNFSSYFFISQVLFDWNMCLVLSIICTKVQYEGCMCASLFHKKNHKSIIIIALY